jgi:Transcriptional regulatory protein, C terminal
MKEVSSMAIQGLWASYAPAYRASEMRILAGWISSGVSGSVVGLAGCGRSNLLRFLCGHPTALQSYLPDPSQAIVLIPIDLYDLPSDDLANLYRTILHAFYWVRERLTPPLDQIATDLYLEHRAIVDPFLTQTALYELLLAFQAAAVRAVLVVNRFDRFCETSTPQMVNTLRSLRDRFKETLSYIVGMRQEAAYLPDPTILGDMLELFDSHTCYVGTMTVADSRQMLANVLRMAPAQPTNAEAEAMLRLSGGFASLLKAIAQWWMLTPQPAPAPSDWLVPLLDNAAVQHRLERLWHGLTQEEKLALSEVHKQHVVQRQVPERDVSVEVAGSESNDIEGAEVRLRRGPWRGRSLAVVQSLAAKGCCVRDGGAWRVNGELLAAFVARLAGRIRGRIWFDEAAGIIYQGQQPIDDLTPLEFNILRFLIIHPRMRHTSDTIIDNAWPEDENKEAVTPNNLQVHISSIRKKIEPNPAAPRFLLTWHGRPSGYQFFPEGKPE